MENTLKHLRPFLSFVQNHLFDILFILPVTLLLLLLIADLIFIFENNYTLIYLLLTALSVAGLYGMYQNDKKFFREFDEALRKAQLVIDDYHARKEKEEKENWDRFIRILFEELEN